MARPSASRAGGKIEPDGGARGLTLDEEVEVGRRKTTWSLATREAHGYPRRSRERVLLQAEGGCGLTRAA